jgi:adenylate cyclase
MNDPGTQAETLRWIDLAREAAFDLGNAHVLPVSCEVVTGDATVRLQPRVMQVLVCLTQGAGEPVTRTVLAHRCWGGVAVGEDAVNRCIQRLRRLSEDGSGFAIETIPRVGYRLHERDPIAASAALSELAEAPPASVCVLPFVNMSGDTEQEYFSDGVSEDIITDLGKASALFVVARTTAFALKGTVVDAREVAERFTVRHVVTGSVRKADGRVRISAQLVDGTTGGQVWAERYDRDFKDIFALQDEISQAIVGALRVRLLPNEKKAIGERGTTSAEAYDLYLMARQKYVSGDQGVPAWGEGIIRACRRATELDPNYAAAWAQLAIGHAARGWQSGASADEGMACAERALALNTDLEEAHTAKARILCDAGRRDEAWREIELALQLDPHSWLANYTATMILWPQHRVREAIPYFEAAAALNDTDVNSPAFLVACYLRIGDHKAVPRAAELALANVEAVLAKNTENAYAIVTGAMALGFLGRMEASREWMERALVLDPDNILVRLNCAQCLLAHFDEMDRGLELLESFIANATVGQMDMIEFSPHLDAVRDDPRFKDMLARAKSRLAIGKT